MDDRHHETSTTEAKRHLAAIAATLGGAVLLTYVVPAFEELRPWRDHWPLESLVTPAERLYAFAGAGSESATAPSDTEALADRLGESVAANLGGGPEEASGPGIDIDPSEYEGIDIRIEDRSGRGMRPFYEALLRTAQEEEGALTRVAHYGDSSIATDLITSTLRRRLQQRFGDGGHGFVLAGKSYIPYRHRDVKRRSRGWLVREITRNHDPAGLYGFGGIQARARPGARTQIATDSDAPVGGSVSRFEIWYQQHRTGGHLWYRVDGGERRTIETRGDITTDRVERVDLPDGPHRLRLEFGGRGQSRVYGVILEREGPGVVYDSLGLVGARASRLLYFDPEHIASQIERRGTDLLVLGFGGNEAGDRIERASYREDFRRVIQRMRAGREDLGCLIFAPLDQAHRVHGRMQTMPTLHDIVAAQRAAAEDAGCAFFDTWAAMGGEGAMARWRRSRPRLAMSDLRHATPAGYEVIGNLFYKALLDGFARYLAKLEASEYEGGQAE